MSQSLSHQCVSFDLKFSILDAFNQSINLFLRLGDVLPPKGSVGGSSLTSLAPLGGCFFVLPILTNSIFDELRSIQLHQLVEGCDVTHNSKACLLQYRPIFLRFLVYRILFITGSSLNNPWVHLQLVFWEEKETVDVEKGLDLSKILNILLSLCCT